MKHLFVITLVFCQLMLFSQNEKDALTFKLEELSKNNSIKGFGVAVYTKDSILYKNGFGFADAANKIPYTYETVQKVASISKLFLGVSLMKLQEMKLLRLDDDVNDYLPFKLVNPEYPNQKITIRHLATHTSGLKKIPKQDAKALYFPTPIPKIKKELPFGLRKIVLNKISKKINKNENLSLSDFLQNLYDLKGKWYNKNYFDKVKAGEKEIYSNSGASLLALIIEKVSGVSYAEFVQKHIQSELGMDDSGFDFNMKSFPKEKKASLYLAGVKVPNDYELILYPAGGFETSIDDLSKFMIAMAKGYNKETSILTTTSFNEMLKTQYNSNFDHGVLWEVYPNSTVGHEGDIVGAGTYAYYNKKQDRGYILFCNTSTTKTIYKDTDKIIETLKNYYDILVP